MHCHFNYFRQTWTEKYFHLLRRLLFVLWCYTISEYGRSYRCRIRNRIACDHCSTDKQICLQIRFRCRARLANTARIHWRGNCSRRSLGQNPRFIRTARQSSYWGSVIYRPFAGHDRKMSRSTRNTTIQVREANLQILMAIPRPWNKKINRWVTSLSWNLRWLFVCEYFVRFPIWIAAAADHQTRRIASTTLQNINSMRAGTYTWQERSPTPLLTQIDQQKQRLLHDLKNDHYLPKQHPSPLAGTGSWLLERVEFKQWLSGVASPFLWCYGPRKTTLLMHWPRCLLTVLI